jgi:Flp pilus assembly protein TadG
MIQVASSHIAIETREQVQEARKVGMRNFLKSLLQNRAGGPALEMALIAPVFIAIMLVTFDMGYMLFVQGVLDGAARNAARVVRTGQAQTSADPSGTFFAALNAGLSGVINSAAVTADVESYADFSTLKSSLPALIDPKTGKPVTNFTPGSPNSAVAVRVTYIYNFMVPWEGTLLMGATPGSARLVTTVVFKNEPYPT